MEFAARLADPGQAPHELSPKPLIAEARFRFVFEFGWRCRDEALIDNGPDYAAN